MAENWQNAFALGPCKVSVYQDFLDQAHPDDSTPIVSGIMTFGDTLTFTLWGAAGTASVDEQGVVSVACDQPIPNLNVHIEPTYDASDLPGRLVGLEADDITYNDWEYPVRQVVVAPHAIYDQPSGDEILYDVGEIPPPIINLGSGPPDGMGVYVYRSSPS